MNIIDKLKDFDSFTTSEQAVIKAILQDPSVLSRCTSAELAHLSYSSTSTVARLCQKLGYKNYRDFSMSFQQELNKREFNNTLIDANIPFEKDDPLEDIFAQLTRLQEAALSETLAVINMDAYRHAIDMLSKAECIDIYGSGINLHLAYDFAYKMARIHRSVSISLDYQQQILSASSGFTDHCAVVISYSGENTATIRCAEELYKHKTPMLAITSEGPNSIIKYASEHICIATMEKQFSKIGPFASCTSIIAILNYLYAGIFSLDYDKNYRQLISTAINVTDFRARNKLLNEKL